MAIRVYYSPQGRRTHDRRARSQERRWLGWLRLGTGIPGCLILLAWMVAPQRVAWTLLDLPAWARWLGAALAPLSLALLFWVHHTLDTNFSPTLKLAQQHHLVTSGPYRWVRHPMYTSLLLVGAAVLLLTANWFIGFITIPGMMLATFLRIPHEETMMIAAFGDAYRRYRRHTGLLLPRLTPQRWQSPRWEHNTTGANSHAG